MTAGRAFSVTADGLSYAGLEWGDPNGYPIVALHGWLDNALSFSVMAPFLCKYRLIALDLSGQGLSDHRSSDATYHIWDDVPQLLSVIASLGLDELVVMGHSRGAAIAVLLATALEEQCSPTGVCWMVCCRAPRLRSPLHSSFCSRSAITSG